MNNTICFAVAGHGKTYNICSKALESLKTSNKDILLIAYTHQGKLSLEEELKKQNYGVLDQRIIIKSWYSFLLSDLIKPYQGLLDLKWKNYRKEKDYSFFDHKIHSIAFYDETKPERFYNASHVQYYVNGNEDLYLDNVSALAYKCCEHSDNKPITRLESIYSHIFIDELQDYAGWDLELFKLLMDSKLELFMSGDHRQSTYRTNNSPKNNQYRDDKIVNFFLNLEKKKQCTIVYANTTRRCSGEICNFVNSIHNEVNSKLEPANDYDQDNSIPDKGVYIIETRYAELYCNHYSPLILRYNKKDAINFKHQCTVMNYGESKGITYDRTLIIPTKTTHNFLKNTGPIIKAGTKSKFYVASTRAKYSIVFIFDKIPNTLGNFHPSSINIAGTIIPAFKYKP